MPLKDFIKEFDIDEKAIARLKRRVFLVGRFNGKRRRGKPETFLFTNRPREDFSELYSQYFTQVRDMSYDSFVECLKPALGEFQDWGNQPKDRGIPKTLQYVPRDRDDIEAGTAIVDTYHYMFLRAISSTRQPELQDVKPALAELQNVGSSRTPRRHPGEDIFALIRRKLREFATFQPHHFAIIDAFGELLARCTNQNGIPAYARGGGLPGGFTEKLIDFIYSEDSRRSFSLAGVDLAKYPWNTMDEKMFSNVVTAFRDAILGTGRTQHRWDTFRGQPLDYQARDVFGASEEDPEDPQPNPDRDARRELAEKFRSARDAYNKLRQVLRSKAMLSMVLDWVLQGYYALDGIPPVGKDENASDLAVALAILQKDGDGKRIPHPQVAAPVLRPTPEERDKFRKALVGENIELLLTALLTSGAEKGAAEKQLPDSLKPVAERLGKNERVTEVLKNLVRPLSGGSTKDAFVGASRMVLLDVLCPTLFEAPVLTKEELLKEFRQGTMRAYLAAIFYSQQNLDAVAMMGEKGRKKFKEGINELTQEFKDVNETAAYFLEKYLELVASPVIANQLINGVKELEEADTVLATAAVTSIAEIVASRPHRDLVVNGGATVRRTPSQPGQVQDAVRDLATQIVRTDPRVVQGSLRLKNKKAKEQAKEASADAVGGTGTSSAGSGSTSVSETGAGLPPDSREEAPDPPDTNDEKPGAGTMGNSQLGRTALTRVEDVLSIFFGSQPEREISPKEITDLSGQAGLTLTGDKDFMRDVRGNMDAFKEALHLIYTRYTEADADKLEFRNEIERLTLINIMLLHQKDLALGTAPSNLYSLLIDLIKFTDPQKLDRSAFIKNISLTRFFTEEQLKKTDFLSGITNLRTLLDAQVYDNLSETEQFASELWGVRYLMDRLEDQQDAEIIVFNASADQFLNWLDRDSSSKAVSSGCMRSELLVTREGNEKNKPLSAQSMQPGLIYFMDSAFSHKNSKRSILERLQGGVASGGLRTIYPPICVSTGFYDDYKSCLTEGANLASVAAKASAPVFVVGPSPDLNSNADYFRTYLPAGYVFVLNFLSPERAQRLFISHVDADPDTTRFRVMGRGADRMDETLMNVFWPSSNEDRYGFASDYHLYVVLTMLTAAYGKAAQPTPERVDDYFSDFYRDPAYSVRWESQSELTPLLIRGTNRCFGFGEKIRSRRPITSGNPDERRLRDARQVDLTTMLVNRDGIAQDGPVNQVRDFEWFNRARQAARLD